MFSPKPLDTLPLEVDAQKVQMRSDFSYTSMLTSSQGENPPLYCTLTLLIAMQGYQAKQTQWMSLDTALLLHWV